MEAKSPRPKALGAKVAKRISSLINTLSVSERFVRAPLGNTHETQHECMKRWMRAHDEAAEELRSLGIQVTTYYAAKVPA